MDSRSVKPSLPQYLALRTQAMRSDVAPVRMEWRETVTQQVDQAVVVSNGILSLLARNRFYRLVTSYLTTHRFHTQNRKVYSAICFVEGFCQGKLRGIVK